MRSCASPSRIQSPMERHSHCEWRRARRMARCACGRCEWGDQQPRRASARAEERRAVRAPARRRRRRKKSDGRMGMPQWHPPPRTDTLRMALEQPVHRRPPLVAVVLPHLFRLQLARSTSSARARCTLPAPSPPRTPTRVATPRANPRRRTHADPPSTAAAAAVVAALARRSTRSIGRPTTNTSSRATVWTPPSSTCRMASA